MFGFGRKKKRAMPLMLMLLLPNTRVLYRLEIMCQRTLVELE